MTPFSALLVDLCRSRRLLQKELAYQLGVDPSYLSALASGRKGKPSDALVQKMQQILELNEDERRALLEAVKSSQLKYRVPEKATPQEHELMRKMFEALGKLKPAQIEIIDAALKL